MDFTEDYLCGSAGVAKRGRNLKIAQPQELAKKATGLVPTQVRVLSPAIFSKCNLFQQLCKPFVLRGQL